MKLDLHTHYYPPAYFERIERSGGDFSFRTSPTGQRIIRYRGARFFGITAPMTDVAKRLEDMDRVGIDTEVISLSTPNVYFAEGKAQADVARLVNDAYADLAAKHHGRFLGFASIPMDDPDAAVRELERALDELRMQGVVLLSNIRGRALADPAYRPFLAEADRRGACVFVHPMIPSAAEAFTEYVLGPIVGFPFDTTLAIAKLCYAGVFKELPNIRWLVAHAGGAVPYLMERLDSGWRDFAECRVNIDEPPSVYLKRLNYDTVTFSPHNLRLLRDVVGADHMVMGSDYPHLLGSIDRAVSSIEAMDFVAREKDRIFSGTALAIMNNVSAKIVR
ncbi:MAG TPA: amidohydrolase family protein [Candidatus Limnocylindria bacterium]|jgi:aminocarboxymuconate-semialdehyde decarboxylase|nr:amidohydrolase family protein [Candidatus Limnocylindria bacterium]